MYRSWVLQLDVEGSLLRDLECRLGQRTRIIQPVSFRRIAFYVSEAWRRLADSNRMSGILPSNWSGFKALQGTCNDTTTEFYTFCGMLVNYNRLSGTLPSSWSSLKAQDDDMVTLYTALFPAKLNGAVSVLGRQLYLGIPA